MASVNYTFTPNQNVRVITDRGIQKGEVIQVDINVLVTETTVRYQIRIENNIDTKSFKETDVFTDLTSALAEYESRIQ